MRRNKTGDEGNGSPKFLYGGMEVGGLLYFAVSVPETEECILKLFRDGSEISSVRMSSENRIGSVFFTAVDNRTLRADSYRYEANGKEFVDPCAVRIIGREQFGSLNFCQGFDFDKGFQDSSNLWGGLIQQNFDWDGEKRPEHDFSDLIIYKLHVRGFTKQENSGVKHKGTYLGVVEKLKYLQELGVNGILLMPCVEFDEFLPGKEEQEQNYVGDSRFYQEICNEDAVIPAPVKINYWGYAAQNFYFAPKASFASRPEQASEEFCGMVKALHVAGMEVYMEMNFTGELPQSLMLQVLRHWVMFYHVDGFRFDTGVLSDELTVTDPVLARTKLFSAGWRQELLGRGNRLLEWNDAFMITARKFLKGDENQVSRFAECFRHPGNGIGCVNYLADHNGFNLQDMYSYEEKHNEANGEQNRDGTEFNYSWNCGAEGKTRKKKINELRLRMKKNAVMALFFSQGIPMLLAGDEFGNSQEGNNNAYCQDNPVGWVDWRAFKGNQEFCRFVKDVIAVRKSHPVFHNRNCLRAMDYKSFGCPDISYHGTRAWYPDYSGYSRTLGILLSGRYAVSKHEAPDSSFYLIFNMHWEPHRFDLPLISGGEEWQLTLSSDPLALMGLLPEPDEAGEPEEGADEAGGRRRSYLAGPRSVAVFESRMKPLADSTSKETNDKKAGMRKR